VTKPCLPKELEQEVRRQLAARPAQPAKETAQP